MGMKIVVIGDSHGNIANLKLVIGFAKKIKAGGIIHSGDWDNLKTVEEVLSSSIPVYAVLGNADIDELIAKNLKLKSKKFDGNFLKFEIDGRKIGVVHDFNHLVSNIEYLDILFCGHRHLKSERIINGVKIVSPGALHSSELSSHTPPFRSLCQTSFAVYDTGTNGVEFFDL